MPRLNVKRQGQPEDENIDQFTKHQRREDAASKDVNMDKLKRQQAVKKTLVGRQKELPKEALKDKPPETEDRTQTLKFCICEVGKSHVPMLTGSVRVHWQNLTKTPILKGEEKGIAFACAKQIASDFIRAQPESDDGPAVQYFQDSAVFALQIAAEEFLTGWLHEAATR